MTIIEAIQTIDTLKPNTYTEIDKIRWLSKLDGVIKTEIVDTHEGTGADFSGYDENTPLDTPLIVKAPYEDVYISWLESRIDYANGETAKYNNSAAVFNSAYADFQNFYNRSHMPKSGSFRFF